MQGSSIFSADEIRILQQLVPQSKYPPTERYFSLAKKFNQKLITEGIQASEPKTGKSIRQQLMILYGKKKITWSNEMEMAMLMGVSESKQWMKIAKDPIFRANDISPTKIKQKFESDMRLKSRIIFRGVANTSYESGIDSSEQISDKAFKIILTGKFPANLQNLLTQDQKQILMETRDYFFQPLQKQDGERYKIRSQEFMNQMLAYFDKYKSGVLNQIADALIKLSEYLKNNKQVPLSLKNKKKSKRLSEDDSAFNFFKLIGGDILCQEKDQGAQNYSFQSSLWRNKTSSTDIFQEPESCEPLPPFDENSPHFLFFDMQISQQLI